MLKKISQKNQTSSINTHDINLLSELSSQEASVITGGYTLRNDTNSTQIFWIFSPRTIPKTNTLQPGQEQDYQNGNILYVESTNPFMPALFNATEPDGTYQFFTEDGKTAIQPIA
jgi:hypothetical protein